MRAKWMIAMATLMLAACSGEPAAVSDPQASARQCGMDTDCKGDRVCDEGKCVAAAPSIIPGAPAPGVVAPIAQTSGSAVPLCKVGDGLVPIPVWTPQSTGESSWTPAPPQQDGQIVYIHVANSDPDSPCGQDDLISLAIPVDPNDALEGGLSVNVRGNAQFTNGACHLKGYYVNQDVQGIHQGWTETYFGAIETKEVVMSGRYCLQSAI